MDPKPDWHQGGTVNYDDDGDNDDLMMMMKTVMMMMMIMMMYIPKKQLFCKIIKVEAPLEWYEVF